MTWTMYMALVGHAFLWWIYCSPLNEPGYVVQTKLRHEKLY